MKTGIIILAVSMLATMGCSAQSKLFNEGKQMQAAQKIATHPGLIRHIDEFEDSVRMVKAEDVPQRYQFVFMNADGIEVDSIDQAAQIIPIVEVRMIATDGQGTLVTKNRAQLIRIQEYGPDHRLLRSTTMRPSLPPVRPLPQSAP